MKVDLISHEFCEESNIIMHYDTNMRIEAISVLVHQIKTSVKIQVI